MADPVSAAVTAIVTAAASATTAAVIAVTGSATLAAAAGNFVLSLASWQTALSLASFAGSFLLTPSIGFEGSPLTWRANVDAGVPFILGRRATAGSIVHRDEWGNENRYNTVWSVYSGGGPINAFEQYYIEDIATSFGGANGTASSGDYVEKIWLQTKTGEASPGALAQTGLLKATPTYEGWDGSSILPYRAASMITFVQDSKGKSFPAGEPTKKVTIQGLKCYDPRLDSTVAGGSGSHRWADPSTWAYSESPALNGLKVAMGIYEGSDLVGGIGAGEDGVDLPAFMEWANVCDANGWVLSAQFTSRDDPHQILQGCMQAGAARYARKGGKISVIVRTPKASVLTINADDTAGPFELALHADRLQKVNTVVPRCVQENMQWEMVPQSEASSATYVTADGGVIERDIDYPFVTVKADGSNEDQPTQLASYAIVDSREPFSGSVPLKPWCADIEPGDVFTVTEPGFLLDGVELLCVRRSFDPSTNIVNVTFISESSGKHAFALGQTNTPPTPPTLTTPDIFTVAAPEIGAFTAAAGSGSQPSILITADADQINARSYVVDFRIDGVGDWRVFGQYDIETTDVTLWGLEPETDYEIGVRYISEFGVLGTRRSLGTTTTNALNAGTLGGNTWTDITDLTDAIDQRIDDAADALVTGSADLDAALTTERDRLNSNVIATNRRVDTLSSNLAGVTASIEQVRAVLSEDDRSIVLLSQRLVSRVEGSVAVIEADYMTAANTDQALTDFDYSQASQFEASVAGTTAISNINTNLSTLASADRALARRIDSLNANLVGAYAGIEQLSTVMVQDNEAITRQTLRLIAEVEGSVSVIESEYIVISDVTTTLANYGLTLTSTFTDLEDAVNDPTTGLAAVRGNVSTILSDYTTASTLSTTLATYGLTLTSTFGDLVGRVDDVEDEVDPNVPGSVAAQVVTNATTFASADRALARTLDSLKANFAGAMASIEQLRTVTSEDNQVTASTVNRVSGTLNGVSATVETMSDVFLDGDGAVAAWLNRVSAGSSTATIEITARDSSGTPVSNIRLVADSIGFGTDSFFEYVDEDPAYSNQPNIYLRDKDGTVVLDGRDISSADWRQPDVLTKAMKIQSVPYWAGLIAEKAGLVARATALSLSSTAYAAAVDAMVAELDSYDAGQPDWDDLTGDTTIDSATLTPLITAVESARDALNILIRAALNWNDLLLRPGWVTDDRVPNGLAANGDIARAVPNASLIPTLTLAKISDAGSLASLNTVAAGQIDTNAVTTEKIQADAVRTIGSEQSSGSRTSAAFTEFELERLTATPVSGSTVLLDVRMGATEILSDMAWTMTVASGLRDVWLRLIRDPDGTPVELAKRVLKQSATGGPTAYATGHYSFLVEDAAHGGGSTTWALVVTSYTAGTTTLNSTTLAHNDITRSIIADEAKR